MKDLMAVVDHMPRVECSVNVFTKVEKILEDGTIDGTVKEFKPCASDMINVEFRIRYDHLHEDETEGYVHSRNFPFLKKHAWHILMIDSQTGEKVFHNARKLRADEPLKKEKDDDYVPYDGSIYTVTK